MMKLVLAALALASSVTIASAQTPVSICVMQPGVPQRCDEVNAGNPLPVDASVNVGDVLVDGFNGETALAPLAVTDVTASSATFTAGKTVQVSNIGSNTAYCRAGPTATTAWSPVFPNSIVYFKTISETVIACIADTGDTTTLNLVVGTGLGTGMGGGSSGGGGGGNVNLDEVAGTPTAVNTGNANAGTQRVVVATDQPPLDVAIVSGGGTGGTASTFGATFPATGTAVGGYDGTDMQPFRLNASTGALLIESPGVAAASTTSGQTMSPLGCAVLTGAPTYTTATTNFVNCTTTGGIRVNVENLAALGSAGSPPGGSTVQTVQGASGATPVIVGGTVASGASDTMNPVKGGAVFSTTQPTVTNGQVVNLQATARGGLIIANGVEAFTVQPGNTANTTPWLVTPAAGTTGGATPGKVLSAASTNATIIKASAGTLYELTAINTTGTIYYLKLYNVATGPTCNSDTVVGTYPVPANTSGNGFSIPLAAIGKAFTTGIGLCLTSGIADNDNGNAATGIAISYGYK